MLLNKILNLNSSKNNLLIKLKERFEFYCNGDNSPFQKAVANYSELEENTKSKDELISCLLEDIIYTSISMTFYEKLLLVISANKALGSALVAEFTKQANKREDITTIQTFQHVNYIEQNGHCDGCKCCDNHHEVSELINYWKNQDFDFFIKMYIGMRTIKITFEEFIYQDLALITNGPGTIKNTEVLQFRQFVYEYSNKNLL